jgi:hypothetical protein
MMTVKFIRLIFLHVHREVIYYESIKRELKISPTYECRYDERLQTGVEEFTRLTYRFLLFGGLEHVKIETRLVNEKIPNTLGEYVT